jgi:hypothetical protein
MSEIFVKPMTRLWVRWKCCRVLPCWKGMVTVGGLSAWWTPPSERYSEFPYWDRFQTADNNNGEAA